MEYKNGELLYVCKKDNDWKDGVFVLYRGIYEGDEDLSYHGSPWYETFIICEYLDSRDRVDFGHRTYSWRPVYSYIKELQNTLNEIRKIIK